MDQPSVRELTWHWFVWLALPAAAIRAQDVAPSVGELCRRAEALVADDPSAATQFTALVEHARRFVATDTDERVLELLEHLSQFVMNRREAGHDVVADARAMVELHSAADAKRPRARWRQVDFRMWGECSTLAGDPARAWAAFQRGLHEVPQENAFETACLHLRTAGVDLDLGRLDAAARSLDAARAAAMVWCTELPATDRSGADPLRRAIALRHADLCLLSDDADGAARALEPVRELGDTGVYLRLCRLLTGDSTVAPELRVTVRNEKASAELRALVLAKLVQHELVTGDLDAVERDLTALEELSPVAQGRQDCRTATLAIEFTLRKAQPYDGDLAARVDVAWAKALAGWRRAPQLPGGIGLLHIGDRATFVANVLRAVTRDGGADATTAAWQRVVSAHAAGAPAVTESQPAGVRDRLLGADHGLLVFVPGRFGTVLLAVDRERITAHTLAPAKSLRGLAESLRAAATDVVDESSDSADAQTRLTTAAAAAAAAVFPDGVQRDLARWRRLSIVGASMLQNLPFELLPVRTPNGDSRLGELVAIDYVANLVAAASAAPRRDPRAGPVVVAGSLLASTRGTGQTMPAAAARLGEVHGERAQLLLDDKADVPAVVAALPRAAIVHCIGHGDPGSNGDQGHAIRFADGPNGLLTAAHVSSAAMHGAVVVLGSCRAGDAPLRRGGDPLAASLAGAMLTAGARCVLAPTTDVRLRYHLAGAAILHRELAAGALPADALLTARRETAASGDRLGALELLLTQLHGRGF